MCVGGQRQPSAVNRRLDHYPFFLFSQPAKSVEAAGCAGLLVWKDPQFGAIVAAEYLSDLDRFIGEAAVHPCTVNICRVMIPSFGFPLFMLFRQPSTQR